MEMRGAGREVLVMADWFRLQSADPKKCLLY